MKKKRLIGGAIWLSATTVLLRGVGLIYRVYLSRRMGEAGMGLYQLLLSVYTTASVAATAGVSIAVTRLVSAELIKGGRKSVDRVMRFALLWSVGLALCTTLVLFVGARGISARFLHTPEGAGALQIVSLGIPFMAVAAVLNGYFLARGKAYVGCISQLFEQAARIGLTVTLLGSALPFGTPAACRAVLTGNAVSEVACTTVLVLFYIFDIRGVPPGGGRDAVFPRFLPIQLPIALSRIIASGLHTVENILIPARLMLFAGSAAGALADFGTLKGMALPLIMFPASALGSISTLLIPALGEKTAQGDHAAAKALTARTLTLTLCFSVLTAGLCFRFGPTVGELLFHSEKVGVLLRFLALLLPFMYLDCMADGLLKGLGQQVASLGFVTIDALVRILLVYLLVPRLGLVGILIMMAASNIGVSLLGLRRLLRVSGARLPLVRAVFLPLAFVVGGQLLTARLPLYFALPLYLILCLLPLAKCKE